MLRLCSKTRRQIEENENSLILDSDIEKICKEVKTIFQEENSLLENIGDNVAIVGDLHGNISDLIHIITTHNEPSEKQKFLFLGDYVDRGENSVETIIYLFCLKIEYPDYVFMIRGNHEFKDVCSACGFSDECVTKYGMNKGINVFNQITSVFPSLPLAAIVQHEYFAVHGGLSKEIESLNDIRNINRLSIVDYHESDIVTGLVWGDPRNLRKGTLTVQSERGVGEEFSEEKVDIFLRDNKLVSILRAHEVCKFGYDSKFIDPKTKVPRCLTIFSTSNYCKMNNYGAIALLSEDGALSIEQHSSSDESSDEE